jgi:MFS transporter, MHS family, proline/betaine transporter
MLRAMLLCLPAGVGFYIVFVFVVSYLQTFVHVSGREALEVNTLSMMGYLGWTLLGGALSDRLGRKPVAVAAMAGLLLFAWPLFDLLDHPRFAFMLSAQLCMAASLGLYFGQLPALLVEALPARVRCSALSLSYNFSVGLSGGLTPLVATWLIQRTGDEMVPAIMLIILAAVTLLALWRTPETAGTPLR